MVKGSTSEHYVNRITNNFKEYTLTTIPKSCKSTVTLVCKKCGEPQNHTVRHLLANNTGRLTCKSCDTSNKPNVSQLRGVEVLETLTTNHIVIICNTIDSKVTTIEQLAILFNIEPSILQHIYDTNIVITDYTLKAR